MLSIIVCECARVCVCVLAYLCVCLYICVVLFCQISIRCKSNTFFHVDPSYLRKWENWHVVVCLYTLNSWSPFASQLFIMRLCVMTLFLSWVDQVGLRVSTRTYFKIGRYTVPILVPMSTMWRCMYHVCMQCVGIWIFAFVPSYASIHK